MVHNAAALEAKVPSLGRRRIDLCCGGLTAWDHSGRSRWLIVLLNPRSIRTEGHPLHLAFCVECLGADTTYQLVHPGVHERDGAVIGASGEHIRPRGKVYARDIISMHLETSNQILTAHVKGPNTTIERA